jgi:putative hydrolase of the HAD superfamily
VGALDWGLGADTVALVRPAVIFDLDETLVVEEASVREAFEAAALTAAAEGAEVDAAELALGARACARQLWHEAPMREYCVRVALASWEGLWCEFDGDGAEVRALREWAPTYRREAWARALAAQGVDDDALAARLGVRFAEERRARHIVFEDAEPALVALRDTHTLAVLTNGATCLQREKLASSGLARYFDVVVASGDIGVGKPDIAVFSHVLERLGSPRRATMVGDNVERDIDGALGAGIGAVWINRDGSPRPEGRGAMREISSLAELRAALT